MNNAKNIQIAIDRIKIAKECKNYYLDLSGLRLSEIPEDISDMDYLIELDLSYNFFFQLPQMVTGMKNLRILNIKNNYLQNIEFIVGPYYSLVELNISNNSLYHIPDSIDYLNDDTKIYFDNNPFLFNLPISLREQPDFKQIKNYIELTKNQDRVERLYETKLIFVGKGEVGKTTLMKVLKNNKTKIIKGKEETTHGININQMNLDIYFQAKPPHYSRFSELDELYKKIIVTREEILDEWDEDLLSEEHKMGFEYYENVYDIIKNFDTLEKVDYLSNMRASKDFQIKKKVKVNLWDFGGQEIYYSTHQFFLTKRSIYIFVWEPRKDDAERDFEYWLNTIKLLGQNSPIIVVMNKSDIRHVTINEKTYAQLFPNIKGFLQVSCVTKSGIAQLNHIISNSISNLEHLGDKLPIEWIKFRKRLKNIKKDFISYSTFVDICKSIGIALNRGQIELLSDYLHDIGDIIHFKADSVLKNIIIINPQWATKAVYSLIDCIPIQKSNGIFNYSDLENYLNLEIYPLETHHQLLQLMERFTICFKVVGAQDLYIIPELLKNEIPNQQEIDEFEDPDSLKFRLKFNFMPKGLISRLICKLFFLLGSNNYWKSGAVLNYESSKALITNNEVLKTLDIIVIGLQKRDLLTIIRNELSKIYLDFNMEENKDIFEEIPCNCDYCQISDPFYFRHDVLRNFLTKDKSHIDCHKSALSVEINKMLSLYRNTKPETKIIYKILSAISQLQGQSGIIKTDEDSRNGFISNQLSHQGVIAKDQSKWGKSSTGEKQGELDIKIEYEGIMTIFEGMNLESINTTTINSHIIKVINKYDANGLPEKYLGIYYTGKNFENFNKKYSEFIEHFNEEEIKFENILDQTKQLTQYSEIKVYKSFYIKSGIKMSLFHILINML